jgi:hypothetical protein
MFVKCAGARFAKLALGILALLLVDVKTQAHQRSTMLRSWQRQTAAMLIGRPISVAILCLS